MAELTVFLRGYTVDVNVTRAFVQKPLGPRADSDGDCYGYSELEFDVLCVRNDEDDRLSDDQVAEYDDNNHDDIADVIWSELEKDNG